LLKRLI